MQPLHEVRRVLTIALFGYFNPQIFRPEWFAKFDLLDPEEEKSVEPLADAVDVLAFSTDSWAMEVTGTRFLVRSPEPTVFDRLLELTTTTFEQLSHTPVDSIAVSREHHQPVPTADALEEALDRFAPRSSWDSLLSDRAERRLTLDTSLEDEHGNTEVRFEVSKSAELDDGLYVGVIHRQQLVGMDEHPEGCLDALRELRTLWARSKESADAVVTLVLG